MAIPPTVAAIFIRIASCFAVMLMLAAAGWSSAAESPALERVNFGYSAAGTVATAPLLITRTAGFQEMLRLKPIHMAGGLTSGKSSTRTFVSWSATASSRAGRAADRQPAFQRFPLRMN